MYIHCILSGLVAAPRFREAEVYAVAGHFGYRFGEGPRFLAMILSIFFSVFIVAAQMAGFAITLARICSAILGVAAIVVAVLWSDIIGLLLFTYQVWAPAIIVPVMFGAMSRKRSAAITLQITITMLASSLVTLTYRFSGFADKFDPAVFGVLVSIVVFFAAGYLVSLDRPPLNQAPQEPSDEQNRVSSRAVRM